MEKTLTDYDRREVIVRTNKVKEALPEYFVSDYPNLIKFLDYYYDFMDGDDSSGANFNFGEEVKNLYRNRDIEAASLKNLDQLIYEIGNELTSADIFGDPRKAAKRLAKFYRTKGSPESLKMFFRMFFGEEIELEYGKNNIFTVGESFIGSESLKYLHNNGLYQLYSVLIKSGLELNKWKDIYKKFVHPAGWYFEGSLQAIGTGSLSMSAPISIEDSSPGPTVISQAGLSMSAPFTALTQLFDSSGDTVRSNLLDTLSVYQSLTLEELNAIGYNSIKDMMRPTSPTFDIDSDAALWPKAGTDFSNIIETFDQAIFRDSN